MAGDWIKMRVDLLTSPKVVRMASALKADRFRIIGGLLSVWSLFDAHSTDGCLYGYTTSALDELVGWSGFADAMLAVSWLHVSDAGLSLPEFDTHNGAPAKRRAQEADRKRRERENARLQERQQPQPSPEVSANSSAMDAPKSKTRVRVEDSREEKTNNNPPAVVVNDRVMIEMPTNRFNTLNETKPIYEQQVRDWQLTYPGVDVPFVLVRIRSWLVNNHGKRKTLSGMNKFIDTWLAKEQNSARTIGGTPAVAGGLTRDTPLAQQLSDRDWAGTSNQKQ